MSANHGNSSAEGRSFYTPGADGFRRAVERRSAAVLVWLHQAPRWLLPAAMAAVFLGGLVLSGAPGAALLGVLAIFFIWLAFIAWPTLQTRQRVLRCVIVAILLVLAIAQTGLF